VRAPEPDGSGDATTGAILDATRAAILDFGVRRTTLTDVARRAGISRMTVYRRYPSVDAVLRDLMTREFGALITEFHADEPGGTARDHMVGRLTRVARGLRDHPLMRKVMEAEPELLMPYVLGRMGGTQRVGAAAVEAELARGQADGSVRDGDPRLLAQCVLLTVQGWVLSAHIAEDVAEDALWAQLPRLLDSALKP
jgi:AcrR family transcriptional regulator